MEKEKEINFRAVTEGLGFHPFSDGLPYAPVSKASTTLTPTPRPMGTGAVAAGPPRIAAAIRNAAQVSAPAIPTIPVALPAQAKTIVIPQRSEAPRARNQSPAQPAAQIPQPTQMLGHPIAESEGTFGFVYLIKRTLAYTLDTTLNISLCVTAFTLALWKQNLNSDLLFNAGIALLATLFLLTFNWALITAQEVAFGTTVGKRLFGLRLVGSPSAIFLRAFFFLPSLGFAGLGILWSVLDPKKRCWHDMIVDLQPVEIASL